MKQLVLISFFILFINSLISGQLSYSGKTFVDMNLNQIDFLNDSVVIGSFMAGVDRYEFRDGRLKFTLPQKILYWSADTIRLANKDALTRKRDTMLFVNVQKRIIKIENFDSLRLDVYGQMAPSRIIIRSDKTVWFSDDKNLPEKELVTYKYFSLSDEKYSQLLDTLGKCLIFMLPHEKYTGGFDITYFDFVIHTNGQTIVSRSDNLSRIHSKLVGFLLQDLPKIAKPFK